MPDSSHTPTKPQTCHAVSGLRWCVRSGGLFTLPAKSFTAYMSGGCAALHAPATFGSPLPGLKMCETAVSPRSLWVKLRACCSFSQSSLLRGGNRSVPEVSECRTGCQGGARPSIMAIRRWETESDDPGGIKASSRGSSESDYPRIQEGKIMRSRQGSKQAAGIPAGMRHLTRRDPGVFAIARPPATC